ncbi:DNA cytosine methyltransferase [Floridanema evergladense]|uniref:DNA cytosine methyltransferase n=1 Tax=Floridaenema evergladense BLCC-F167 TaxID=3153639 RepID=A0ABV4WI19_9CYAN
MATNKLPYLDFIEQELRLSPNQQNKPLVIDLFAGCGGMALGFEAAGFQTVGYEIIEDACATYQLNLQNPCHHCSAKLLPEISQPTQYIF